MSTALAAGSLNYNGPREIYIPPPILVATNSGGGEAGTTLVMLAKVPSSQVRVKLSLTYFPAPGNPLPDLHNDFTIWVSACEEDAGGIAGGGGRLIPVTDLEGTSTAPTNFPESTGLGGYAREFVTASPWIQIVAQISSIGTPGNWVLQASLQPDAVSFVWPAWDQIRREFSIQLVSGFGTL